MNAAINRVLGEAQEGGYCYVGRIGIDGREYAILVSPRMQGDHDDIAWNRSMKSVTGAQSFCDGLANTRAMAEAGSKLAEWALGAEIGGQTDLYIPALDESDICYRVLKPGVQQNSQWGRSGINVNAVPPTSPYTLDLPAQTSIEAFRTGGAEAFQEAGYWTSTQHASVSDCAWGQDFGNGGQTYWSKDLKLRARLVRRVAI